MENEFMIKFDWLKLEDYQFRLLMLIKMLSNNKEQTTYTGTLQDMRNWLNLGQSQKNNNYIVNAINELKKNNIIDYTVKGRTYTIFIIDNEIPEKDNIIDKIDKDWINIIRDYNISNNKRIIGNMLKVLLYAYYNTKGTYKTQEELGELLNLTYNQLKNATDNLKLCDFKNYCVFEKRIEKARNKEGATINLGTILQFMPNAFYYC